MLWKRKFWVLSASALIVVAAVSAKSDELGRAEYDISCASCHGTDAKGNGPMAKFLNVEVPDLTTLSA